MSIGDPITVTLGLGCGFTKEKPTHDGTRLLPPFNSDFLSNASFAFALVAS